MSDNLKDVKKTKHNTKPKRPAKILPYKYEFLDMTIGKRKPVNASYLEDFGLQLVKWANQQEHEPRPKTKLKDFYAIKGIDHRVVDDWCARNERLKTCKEHAKMILGNLRENGVNRKEFYHGMIARIMYKYDDDWKEVEEYHANLKKATQDDKTVIQYIYQEPLTTDTEKE